MSNINKKPSRSVRRAMIRRKRVMKEMIVDEYLNIALSIFSWNVDKDVYNNRLISNTIEKLLAHNGVATIFRNEAGVIEVRSVGGVMTYNSYNEPITWEGIAINPSRNRNVKLNVDNAVLIYNNKTKTPSIAFINHWAETLIDIDNTIQQQLKAHKTPFVFYGKEEDLLTFKQSYENLVDGYGMFFYDSSSATAMGKNPPFNLFNADIEFKIDKLLDVEDKYENKILKRLGLQANYVEKKAQLNKDETNKNDDIVLINFNSFKTEREYARMQMERVLGTPVELVISDYLSKQRGVKDEEVEDDETK